VSTTRTRLEREIDIDTIRALKPTTDADIGVRGPTLAAHFVTAGLVDTTSFCRRCSSAVAPVSYPGVRLELDLIDERHLGNGVVFLHYRPRA
jgi:hypothetical protein